MSLYLSEVISLKEIKSWYIIQSNIQCTVDNNITSQTSGSISTNEADKVHAEKKKKKVKLLQMIT